MIAVSSFCSGHGFQNGEMFDLLPTRLTAPRYRPLSSLWERSEGSSCTIYRDRSYAIQVGQSCAAPGLAAWGAVLTPVPSPRWWRLQRRRIASWAISAYSTIELLWTSQSSARGAMDEATKSAVWAGGHPRSETGYVEAICQARGAYVAILNAENQKCGRRHTNALTPVVQDALGRGRRRRND